MAEVDTVEHADGQIGRPEVGKRAGRVVEFQAL